MTQKNVSKNGDFFREKFGSEEKVSIFAIPFEKNGQFIEMMREITR